ncbi:MAG: patatin-like phospholipase family protein [Actinomycetota bacterium]|nr:patatin-like phospholipase family protein [Actinomycetota bacterium]
MKTGLVLGGGGLVGISYHAGVLKALDDCGVHVKGSEIIVGTSAGALVAAYLASGWAAADFYEYSFGRHPSRSPAETEAASLHSFDPLWTSMDEHVRRAVGSVLAVAASRGIRPPRLRGHLSGARLRGLFPPGMYSLEATRARLEADLPRAWPRQGLHLCAVDLEAGRRVVFDKRWTQDVPFADAVLAAIAIPGFFPPVQIGNRPFVDAGVVSTTSLDVAVELGCDTILCIAPLGYRFDGMTSPRDPKLWPALAVRSIFARSLRRSLGQARDRSVSALVIRPGLTEVRRHGSNAMRRHDEAGIAEAAREGTVRLIEDNTDHPAVRSIRVQ